MDGVGESGSCSDELELTKDSLAAVLRILGEYALPTVDIPREDFADDCEELARRVLIRARIEEGAGDTRLLKQTHVQLRDTVRKQRRSESREYSAHRQSAQLIVSDLVANLRRAMELRGEQDSEAMAMLSEMENSLKTGDLKKITVAATRASRRIRAIIEEQRSLDVQNLDTLSKQLQTMQQELDEAQAQMQRDPLTELLNRGAFDRALEGSVYDCKRSGVKLGLFMLDIDRFKSINDRYGHQTGDEVLKKVTRALVLSFPRKDDIVARYGGEEFAALCRTVGVSDAPMMAERARRAIEKLEIKTDLGPIHPTISVGFSVLRPGDSAASFLKRADEALYRAKRQGRNRVAAEEPDGQ